jgi:hypothetical protein
MFAFNYWRKVMLHKDLKGHRSGTLLSLNCLAGMAVELETLSSSKMLRILDHPRQSLLLNIACIGFAEHDA